MMARRFKLIRQRNMPSAGGTTLFFTCEGGSRKYPLPIFRPDQVPEFEGESAWFEAERVPKMGWRIVRRVNEHGQPFEDDADGRTVGQAV